MNLNIIVAVDEAGGFGKDGKIPWNIPEDMKHFKETTKNAVCVMGRYTYEDMLRMRLGSNGVPGKTFTLLPGRDSYVVSSNEELECVGATRVPNLHAVFQKYKNTDRDVFVIGGRRMFIEAMNYKPTIYMTVIKGDTYDCDVGFPLDFHNNYVITDGEETDLCYYVKYESV